MHNIEERMQQDVFTSFAGRLDTSEDFEGWLETRELWIVSLGFFNSSYAHRLRVEAALQHLSNFENKLCPTSLDLPIFMIQAGLDQAAYDVIKWFAKVPHGSDFSWSRAKSSFLNFHGENVFENIIDLRLSGMRFKHIAALTLLKARLLASLENYRSCISNMFQSQALPPKLPQEVFHMIAEHTIEHPIIARMPGIWDPIVLHWTIINLRQQIPELYSIAAEKNSFFWDYLLGWRGFSLRDCVVYAGRSTFESAFEYLVPLHRQVWDVNQGAMQLMRHYHFGQEMQKWLDLYPEPNVQLSWDSNSLRLYEMMSSILK
ncbi:40S ribosomal protein S13 [Elsinoe australis]|uniref:40S ribosomal protein S13 n=1 Tax=Elsinoe australis TaxID=40998 RepID=A0A2P7ZDQ7_9PEZI|nr:40S ribosomal protein S13 [Elsinoe australis]